MVKLIRKGKKKKGFTLIELVAVVAIIGILAALLVPKIAGYIEDAKKTKVVDQARQVYMAVQTHNTKADSILPLESTTVTEALEKEGVYKYMGLTATGTAGSAGSTFPNLNGNLHISECKKIVEGAKFFIDDDGVVKVTGNNIATS